MRNLFAPLCLVGLSCNLGVPASAPSSSEEQPGIASGTEVAVEVPLPPVQVSEESEATRRLAFPASFQEPGAPPVAAPVVDEPVRPDGPRSPVFPQDQDAISWDTEALVLHASIDAYCDAAQDRAAKRRESYDTPVTLGPIGCFEVSPRVSFRAGGGFLALRALRVSDGESSYTTLLAQRKDGLLAVPVSWDVDDPNDPGCKGIVRDKGLEQVTVQHGALVVVSLGERITYVTTADDEDGAREMLLRSVMVVKPAGESFVGRGFTQAAYGGPELGFKLQPSARFTPWQNLPWKERQPVVVDSEGRLLFKGS